MPIYEYLCEQCHNKQEIMQKIGDPPPEVCPKCQAKNSLQKMVTSSAFHLKGGGWYKDLYSSPKKAESSSNENKTKTCDANTKKDKVEKTPKKENS